jgi:cytochrome oxidase Cu insertion factor (SCO1/SenC/PrrC family)
MSDERPVHRGRLSFFLIAAVAIAPIAGGYALYYWWRPATFTNYGQLIPPTLIGDVGLRQADGTEFRLNAFKGKWVFLTVDSGVCDQLCRQKLYKIRQVRLTQGKDMDRIERVWLVDDDASPSSAITAEYEGTRIVSARGSALLSRLPGDASVRDNIYIVDPLGNLMMRYPSDADPSKIKRDVTKLLKASRIG